MGKFGMRTLVESSSLIKFIYFLAIGLKAAQYCDENTEFIKNLNQPALE